MYRYSALSTYNVQKRFKESQCTVVMVHNSQINSIRNSNVLNCFLKFCTLSAALMSSGSSFQRRGAYRHRINALSPNLFRLMCGIGNKFLVFDLRVLVLACLTNSSFKYRGAHPCMHLKVKSRILNSRLELNPFPDGQPVKIF